MAVYESTADAVALSGELRAGSEPLLILGGGSNLLLTHDLDGMVVTADKRFDVQVTARDAERGTVDLRCWAGTTFDEVVAYGVEHGYHGMENLSLIPGECGASAVQNIGAYGVEAKDVITQVEAVEIATGHVVTIEASRCGYGYRQSRFKQEWRDRYLITYVTYRLTTAFVPRLDYGNILHVLDERGVAPSELTARQLREIIIDIRRSKLPDPEEWGNAGSFFMNPVVDGATLERLKREYPDIRYFDMPAAEAAPSGQGAEPASPCYKIPAAWLIDRCGWKGKTLGRAGVYEKQALVLINRGGASGSEVVALMEAIQQDVLSRFGLHIYPEVNIR